MKLLYDQTQNLAQQFQNWENGYLKELVYKFEEKRDLV